MEERHMRLQQFEEHDVMKITTRIHRDLYVKKAAKHHGSDAGDDAEYVYIYGIHSVQQVVRVQRELGPRKLSLYMFANCLTSLVFSIRLSSSKVVQYDSQ